MITGVLSDPNNEVIATEDFSAASVWEYRVPDEVGHPLKVRPEAAEFFRRVNALAPPKPYIYLAFLNFKVVVKVGVNKISGFNQCSNFKLGLLTQKGPASAFEQAWQSDTELSMNATTATAGHRPPLNYAAIVGYNSQAMAYTFAVLAILINAFVIRNRLFLAQITYTKAVYMPLIAWGVFRAVGFFMRGYIIGGDNGQNYGLYQATQIVGNIGFLPLAAALAFNIIKCASIVHQHPPKKLLFFRLVAILVFVVCFACVMGFAFDYILNYPVNRPFSLRPALTKATIVWYASHHVLYGFHPARRWNRWIDGVNMRLLPFRHHHPSSRQKQGSLDREASDRFALALASVDGAGYPDDYQIGFFHVPQLEPNPANG
ncbi:hypothetical protein BC830DRAFT_938640 [Chytriomyces sp. MP71]|nr:hypothetical protein BC830DRAFT_938640 [Chytriomyces sp. MP71]